VDPDFQFLDVDAIADAADIPEPLISSTTTSLIFPKTNYP
jgi:hypothetical protein